MAFMGILLVMFPFLAIMGAALLALLYFLAACLLLLGITGIVMNILYKKGTGTTATAAVPLCNAVAIVVGLVLALLPIAFALYNVVAILLA